jgi:hypothetical protein
MWYELQDRISSSSGYRGRASGPSGGSSDLLLHSISDRLGLRGLVMPFYASVAPVTYSWGFNEWFCDVRAGNFEGGEGKWKYDMRGGMQLHFGSWQEVPRSGVVSYLGVLNIIELFVEGPCAAFRANNPFYFK